MNARTRWQRQSLAWMALMLLTVLVFVWLENRPRPWLLWPVSQNQANAPETQEPSPSDQAEMADTSFLNNLPPLDVQVYANPRSRVGRLLLGVCWRVFLRRISGSGFKVNRQCGSSLWIRPAIPHGSA